MKTNPFRGILTVVMLTSGMACTGAAGNDTIPRRHTITLREAHIGNLEIDTLLLTSYEPVPAHTMDFYMDARTVFMTNPETDFSDSTIVAAARKYDIPVMGGPMLGNLAADGVTIWMRPASKDPVVVRVKKAGSTREMSRVLDPVTPGVEERLRIDGLEPGTTYRYEVHSGDSRIAQGGFRTPPPPGEKGAFTLTFGSCFHKIGLHNPNLIHQVLERKPHAMMLLGDIAVDDRRDRINMHRSDYLLRDLAPAWKQLSANVPLYTSWDDHDYFDNDLAGIPEGFTGKDRRDVRAVWHQNWNNPANDQPGIYFNTRLGPVELIMLDTRSCRENQSRGEYGSFLGKKQLTWLKEVLRNSEAPYKVISSGTMWSDYVSNGKDSWGTWDTIARAELFDFIASEKIPGVLLLSGDRHGARGFRIPTPSGFVMHEFETASLGGVPGPDAMAPDTTHQLYGYHGKDAIAFGEFRFDTTGSERGLTFRLIDQYGHVLEKIFLPYESLRP